MIPRDYHALCDVADAAQAFVERAGTPHDEALYAALSGLRMLRAKMRGIHPNRDRLQVRAAVLAAGTGSWTVFGTSHLGDSGLVAFAKREFVPQAESLVGWLESSLDLSPPVFGATVVPLR
jgi:hypothetical protein